MDAATCDAVVTGYEQLIPTLELPDPHDRHVLAAAIVGRCDIIITKNLDHFTREALGPYWLDVRDPDDFLLDQLELAPGLFCQAISKIRSRLSNPPYTVEEYLATRTRCGLVRTAAELHQFTTLL
jgi:hypothetical protein